MFHARLLARDDQQVIHVSKGDDVNPNLVKLDPAAKERGLEGRGPEAEIDHDAAQVPLPAQACTPQAVQGFVEDEVSNFSTLQGEITRELDHSGLDNVSEQKCSTYVEALKMCPFAALERIILSASTLAVLLDNPRSRAKGLP